MTPEQIEATLADEAMLKAYAEITKLSVEAARALLERMLKEPEIAEQAKDYIWSSERSEDFKGYVAGEEKGYAKGHEAGFAKGAMVGALAGAAAVAVAGLAIAAKLKP